ncbi:MAG: peptidoglycan D,D-transpeptidase FtsI family protein [Planctomycetaceae bacterium]
MNELDRALPHRARMTVSVLLTVLILLAGRAGYLQVVLGEEYAQRAYRQHFETIEEMAPRGRILDRHGRIFAASYHARSLGVNLGLVEDPDLLAASLAYLLDEPKAAPEIAALLRRRIAENKRFIFVRRRLDREVADRIEAARAAARQGSESPGTRLHALAAVEMREDPRRELPHGSTAAAVIGMVGEDGEGLCGLERRFDRQLRGRPGHRFVMRNGGLAREVIDLYPERGLAAEPGPDLATTLDLAIQQVAEEELDRLQGEYRPAGSCAVVLDLRTGELLAMAGRPSLDPAAFPRVDPAALRIPALHFPYEPGSTLKPLLLAAALSCGAVRTDRLIDCGAGSMRFGGRTLRDVHENGVLSLCDVLVKSSNIGMAQVGRALGIDRALGALLAAGLGERTGIELAGEDAGAVTARPRWHEDYTLVSVSMGHEILVTPLQLACALSALLSGEWRRPTLLQGGPPSEPRSLGYDRAHLDFVIEAMVKVVEEGTGKKARVPGVRVGGKTGTSGKYPEGCGDYVASFYGFAPADAPRFAVLVVVDEPRKPGGGVPYGSTVAAPAVGRILQQALSLQGVR